MSGKWFQTEQRLWLQKTMLALSFESLRLRGDDHSAPTPGVEDEFDTDLESDGKYIKFFFFFSLHFELTEV